MLAGNISPNGSSEELSDLHIFPTNQKEKSAPSHTVPSECYYLKISAMLTSILCVLTTQDDEIIDQMRRIYFVVSCDVSRTLCLGIRY